MTRILIATLLLLPLLAHAVPAEQCVAGAVRVSSQAGSTSTTADFTPCYTTTLPAANWTVGQSVDFTVGATFWGCDASNEWSIVSGLPSGLALSGNYGRISGTLSGSQIQTPLVIECDNGVAARTVQRLVTVNQSGGGGALMAWVDPLPTNPCDAAVSGGATCGDGTLHCPTSVAEARTAIQNAANANDVIAFRGEAGGGPTGGIYVSPGGTTPMFNVAASGMSLCPYPGEVVKLHGRDAATALAEYNSGVNTDSNHVGILASDARDDFTIQGFDELAWFGEAAISAGGDNLRIVDNRFGSNYRRTVQIGEGDCCGAGSVSTNDGYVAFNRSFNTVDFTWLAISVDNSTTHRTDRMRVRHNITLNGGREPDGDIVSGGGGNADLYGSVKNCADNGPPNKCQDWDISWNIGYNATDGAFDGSLARFTAIGNVFFTPGPVGSSVVGWKQLRSTSGAKTVAANIVHGANRMGNAFEMRVPSDEVTQITVSNNLWAFGSGNINHGADPTIQGVNVEGIVANNVAYQIGAMQEYGNATFANNWTTGNPNLVGLVSDYVPPILALMENDALDARTRFIQAYTTIATAHEPADGSPMIDAGVIVSGLHCATADDDPVTPADPAASCLHWLGDAPDQGPIERGLY